LEIAHLTTLTACSEITHEFLTYRVVCDEYGCQAPGRLGALKTQWGRISMLKTTPTPETEAELRERVDRLCAERFMPIVHGWEDHGRTCRPLIEAIAEEGLFGLTLPTEYGGAGRVDRYSAILCLLRERFGYHDALIDTQFAIQGLGTNAILRMGTDDQRDRYLPGLVEGKTLFSFALTEPHSGSDVLGMRTRAHRDGDEWVLNGSKMFISGAPDSDVYITFARTDDGDKRSVTAFLMETGMPGFTARGGIALQAPHAIGYLDFDECRIPDSQRLGEVGQGLRACLGTLEIFRPSVGSATLGMARRALDLAIGFSTGREAFGGHLSDLEGIRLKLGTMAAMIEGGAALVDRAANLRDSGQSTIVEGAVSKAFATESAVEVIYQAQQIHGGRGVIVGEEIEMISRAVRPTTIYEGASEVQRSIIGRAEAKRIKAGGARPAITLDTAPADLRALLEVLRSTYESWIGAAGEAIDKPAFHVRLAETAMAVEAAETCPDGHARYILALSAARALSGNIARTGGTTDCGPVTRAVQAIERGEDAFALAIAEQLIDG